MGSALYLETTPLLPLLQALEASLLLWARPGLEIGHICRVDWGKVGRCGGVLGGKAPLSVGSGEMGREGDEAVQVRSIGCFLSVKGVVIIPYGV